MTPTPASRTFLKVYAGLATSGLLAQLSGSQLKVLLALGLEAHLLGGSSQAEHHLERLTTLGIVTPADRGRLFCYLDRATLAARTGLSLRAVTLATSALAARGLVEKRTVRSASGRHDYNVYLIQPAAHVAKFAAVSTEPTPAATVGTEPIPAATTGGTKPTPETATVGKNPTSASTVGTKPPPVATAKSPKPSSTAATGGKNPTPETTTVDTKLPPASTVGKNPTSASAVGKNPTPETATASTKLPPAATTVGKNLTTDAAAEGPKPSPDASTGAAEPPPALAEGPEPAPAAATGGKNPTPVATVGTKPTVVQFPHVKKSCNGSRSKDLDPRRLAPATHPLSLSASTSPPPTPAASRAGPGSPSGPGPPPSCEQARPASGELAEPALGEPVEPGSAPAAWDAAMLRTCQKLARAGWPVGDDLRRALAAKAVRVDDAARQYGASGPVWVGDAMLIALGRKTGAPGPWPSNGPRPSSGRQPPTDDQLLAYADGILANWLREGPPPARREGSSPSRRDGPSHSRREAPSRSAPSPPPPATGGGHPSSAPPPEQFGHLLADRPPPSEEQAFWDQVLDDLRGRMARATFDHWLNSSRLLELHRPASGPARLVVSVVSPSAADWLEHRLEPVVRRAVEWRLGRPARLTFRPPAQPPLSNPTPTTHETRNPQLVGASSTPGAAP